MQGWAPAFPRSGGCAPTAPRAGAPPCTRVTFPSRGKSPKARQGLCLLESPRVPAKLWEPDPVRFEGWSASPIELEAITIPYRPFRARWQIGLLFSPSYTGGHILRCQSVARQLGLISAYCPEFLTFLGGAATPRGDDNAPKRGPGAQPRHAFASFRRETKGTPGVGRVGLPMGGVQRTGPHLWCTPPRIPPPGGGYSAISP